MRKYKYLFLFDIDGTLLRTRKRGMRAFGEAIREVYGVAVPWERFNAGGKTDGQIVREMLAAAGVPPGQVGPGLARTKRLYLRHLRRLLTRSAHIQLMPGAREFLRRLAARRDCLSGLLTGNFREGARRKLALPGLWKEFRFGAFADDSVRRVALAPLALRRAERLAGHRFRRDQVFVVGDTVHDVACAKAIRAVSLTVGTGAGRRSELLRSGADHYFPDLSKALPWLDRLRIGRSPSVVDR